MNEMFPRVNLMRPVLQFLVTAGSQTFQQLGRLGQDIVGANDGGLLALLEGLFVGVEVSKLWSIQRSS